MNFYSTTKFYYSLKSGIAKTILNVFGTDENGIEKHNSGVVVTKIIESEKDDLGLVKLNEVVVEPNVFLKAFQAQGNRNSVSAYVNLNVISLSEMSADIVSLELVDLFKFFVVDELEFKKREFSVVGKREWHGINREFETVSDDEFKHRLVSFDVISDSAAVMDDEIMLKLSQNVHVSQN